MSLQPPSDRWYYAQNKKKMGPVVLARLRHLLAEGVLTPADMILQEGATTWRRLAEVAGTKSEAAHTGSRWKMALVIGAAMVLLALLSWSLIALLGRSNKAVDVKGPEPVTQAPNKAERKEAPPKSVGSQGLDDKDLSREPDSQFRAFDNGPYEPPRLVTQLGHSNHIHSIAMSGDGTLAATGGYDRVIIVWDVRSGSEVRRFRVDSFGQNTVAFSGNGKLLAIGSNNLQDHPQSARVWDVVSGKEIQTFKGHSSGVSAVALSADGEWLATGSWDQTARLWEVRSGKEVQCCRHTTRVHSVALSADAKWLATGSEDGTARMWDTRIGKEVQHFCGHAQRISCVAMTRDGKRLATTSGDQTIRLWDVASGKEVQCFPGQMNYLSSVSLSADGKWLATAGLPARVWDTTSGKEVQCVRCPLEDAREFEKQFQ